MKSSPKTYTVKVPPNIREIDIEQFLPPLKPGRFSSSREVHRQLLLLARDRLATIGNQKNNAVILRETVAKEFLFLGAHAQKAVLKSFIDSMRPQPKPIVLTEPVEIDMRNHARPEDETRDERLERMLGTLINENQIIKTDQTLILERLKELAMAMHNGGNKGFQTALNKLPWLRD